MGGTAVFWYVDLVDNQGVVWLPSKLLLALGIGLLARVGRRSIGTK
jgi:hypothetical protein